jgi:RNA ligase (TIGR02306 family)
MIKNYDVEFLNVTDIYKHPNADKLEMIATGSWISIAPIGKLKLGETVIFIHPDAKLNLSREWTKNYANFVSHKNGRVKTIKLRGSFSEGLIVRIDDLIATGDVDENKLREIQLSNNSDELASLLDITHYEIPFQAKNFGNLKVKMDHLPYSLEKTDQVNVQQLDTEMYLNKSYLVTRKMDGSSCTITVENGQEMSDLIFHVCSRRIDLKLDGDNIFTRAAKTVIEKLESYFDSGWRHRLDENCVLVLRGEVCGAGIQTFKHNIDCNGDPTFNLFEAYILNKKTHTIETRMNPKEFSGILGIKCVPIICLISSLTPEMVNSYLTAPASLGEGVVLWETESFGSNTLTGQSFKIKSKDYDSLIG